MTETKIVELIIQDENQELAIDAISLVTSPAIEQDFVFFGKEKNNLTFAKVDEEKRMLVSPALIPNKNIFRHDPNTDSDYYVYFSKETVRDILQNRIYLGKIKYQKYKRRSDGRRSYEAPIEWFDGKHEAVIDGDLFDRCQQVRAKRRSHRQSTKRYNPYLLRGLLYCHRCCSSPPEGKSFKQYGKMRAQ